MGKKGNLFRLYAGSHHIWEFAAAMVLNHGDLKKIQLLSHSQD